MRSAGTDLAESGRVRVWWLALLLALALTRPAAAAPVVVRFPESATHGFLVLRGANGDVLAHGEFVQAQGTADREPPRVPLQGRLAVGRDGDVHPGARVPADDLPPRPERSGALRGDLRRLRSRHRPLSRPRRRRQD